MRSGAANFFWCVTIMLLFLFDLVHVHDLLLFKLVFIALVIYTGNFDSIVYFDSWSTLRSYDDQVTSILMLISKYHNCSFWLDVNHNTDLNSFDHHYWVVFVAMLQLWMNISIQIDRICGANGWLSLYDSKIEFFLDNKASLSILSSCGNNKKK